MKYRRLRVVNNLLGNILSQSIKQLNINDDVVVVPVPLHFSRYWKRGFNQAENLADFVAKQNNWLMKSVLIRNRATLPQFGLNKIRRKQNMADAFLLKKNSHQIISGKIVILVDDIVTTGFTLNECAKILRQNGAKEVWGLVLARA